MNARNPVTQTSFERESSIGPGRYEGLLAPVESLLGAAVGSRTSTARRLRLLGAVGRRVDSLFQRRAASFRVAGAGAAALARRERLRGLLDGADALWARAVLPSLRERGIAIHEWGELREDERRALAQIFIRELSPLLTPLTVDATHPFPAVASLSLNVAVLAREPRTGAERFIGIEIPPTVPRLLCATPSARLVPVECVIGANLPALLPDLEVVHHHPFRVTRDGRPLRANGVANGLASRTRTAVRLEVDAAMPSAQRARLIAGLGLAGGDLDAVTAPLDLAAVTAEPLARLLARGRTGAACVRAGAERGGCDDGGR